MIKYNGKMLDNSLLSTAGFAWYYFITSVVFLAVRVYAHYFLIKMALKM